MIEYHILPIYDSASHMCASACPCNPSLRSKEDAGLENVWQHNDPKLKPPIMVGGLMAGNHWKLYQTGGGTGRNVSIS